MHRRPSAARSLVPTSRYTPFFSMRGGTGYRQYTRPSILPLPLHPARSSMRATFLSCIRGKEGSGVRPLSRLWRQFEGPRTPDLLGIIVASRAAAHGDNTPLRYRHSSLGLRLAWCLFRSGDIAFRIPRVGCRCKNGRGFGRFLSIIARPRICLVRAGFGGVECTLWWMELCYPVCQSTVQ